MDNNLTVHSLVSRRNLRMTATNFGGKIISLVVPDREGRMADIVLGYDLAEQYFSGNPYFGALIGRFGNRIANGRFRVDGKEYRLVTNNGTNALHGGPGGFHNVVWTAFERETSEGPAVELKYMSKDGEEGYPGNLIVKVTYTLTHDNALQIDYEATTDQPTIVNLTHHSYFNLAGEGDGRIMDHQMMINADHFCEVNEALIPTGTLQPVKGTPLDFTTPHAIGERIAAGDKQLEFGRGYDHTWVLRKERGTLALAARVTEPSSGRVMEVWTTEPGLQFYSGNFLDGSDIGKGGKRYPHRAGFCLEAQHFPDSPNQDHFPSVVLRPGEEYRQTTVYKFFTD